MSDSFKQRLKCQSINETSDYGMRALSKSSMYRVKILGFHFIFCMVISLLCLPGVGIMWNVPSLFAPCILFGATIIALVFHFLSLDFAIRGYVSIKSAASQYDGEVFENVDTSSSKEILKIVGDANRLKKESLVGISGIIFIGGAFTVLSAWTFSLLAAVGFACGFVAFGIIAYSIFKRYLGRISDALEKIS